MDKKYRYVTKTISFAPGTVGIQQVFKTTLDNSYDEVIGVVLYENSNASNDAYKLSLEHGGHVIQELTHKNDWIGSTSVPFCERYKPLKLSAKDETMVSFKPNAALVGTVDIDVTFILSKANVC